MKKYLLLSILILNSSGVIAYTCPSGEALKSVRFRSVEYRANGYRVVANKDYYDTENAWTFVVEGLNHAGSPQDAIVQAEEVVRAITSYPVPALENDNWVCIYPVSNTYRVIAYLAATD